MEKIKIRINQDKMDYAFIDNILYGSAVWVDKYLFIDELHDAELFEVIENKNNINGLYYVVLNNAYIERGSIIVDMRLDKVDYDNEPSKKINFYNEEKYIKTESFKYLENNAKKLTTTAIKSVRSVIDDNDLRAKTLEDRVRRSMYGDNIVYLLDYIKNGSKLLKQSYDSLQCVPPRDAHFYRKFIMDDEKELMVGFVNYINLHNLNGIVFVDEIELEYIRKIGEEYELTKNKERHIDKNNKEFDIDNKQSNKKSSSVKHSNYLACFSIIDDENLAYNISEKLKIQNSEFKIGKYIFVAAKKLDDFINENMKPIYKTKKPLCFNEKDFQCGQNCMLCKGEKINVSDTVIKLTFLHELGHMAFSNCSRVNRMVVDETAANLFASLCTNKIEEHCMIREITNIQPEEYKYYFPTFKTVKAVKIPYPEEPDEYSNEYYFRTLKYGNIRCDDYYRLVEELVDNLYF